jgi:hypothetical protein
MKPASHFPVFDRKSYRDGQSAGRYGSIKPVVKILAFAELTSVIFLVSMSGIGWRRSGISISTWLRVTY